MILYKHYKDIQHKIEDLKQQGNTIGFVPTMGALHQGHLSLIEASREQNDITVCSIFVNPTQFNDPNDFKKYPVTIESDILLLTENKTDILFLPSVSEIYPEGTTTNEQYDLGELETTLEGKYRPGHFQGVCQVVSRLFSIIQPHRAYFGQKDYQQCMIIKKLVSLQKLPVNIVVHPTIREKNGLAMSSRNLRLTEDEREKATSIYKALSFIKNNKSATSIHQLKKEAAQMLLDAGFNKIDYFEITNSETLQPLEKTDDTNGAIALMAAFLSGVRLIDNLLL